MTIYEIKQAKLSFDWGRFEGYEIIGYWANKKTAEEIATALPRTITEGEVIITEIEVNE